MPIPMAMQKLLNYKELIYGLIINSGSVGLNHREIEEQSQLNHAVRQKILYQLRAEGKIYFSINVAKWKLIKYKSDFERQSMEWAVG